MVRSGFTLSTFAVPTRVFPSALNTVTLVGGNVIGAKTVITSLTSSFVFTTFGIYRSIQYLSQFRLCSLKIALALNFLKPT